MSSAFDDEIAAASSEMLDTFGENITINNAVEIVAIIEVMEVETDAGFLSQPIMQYAKSSGAIVNVNDLISTVNQNYRVKRLIISDDEIQEAELYNAQS